MRLIFAGTPEFARVALQHLLAARHEVALVLTQPDRPAGRGMKLQPSAVKQLALAQQIALAQPRSLRLDGNYAADAAQARAAMQAAQADAMVVVAFGLLLPPWLLDLMRQPGPGGAAPRGWGCFNIHASLLPRWRGAAPIQRAIEAGDAQTGISIMQMDAGLDTGDVLLQQALPIGPHDNSASLHQRLADLGGSLMLQVLAQADAGTLRPQRQPGAGISYAHKIEKAEAAIDWTLPADLLARRVRAFNPAPGACTAWAQEPLKVWQAQAEHAPALASAQPGQVLSVEADGIRVQTGCGVLRLTELQRAGGKRLAVADFLRGFALTVGQVFDASPRQKTSA
ncbi:methionyl-tRNA formyltransferase [Hydrogenophaga sp.]|uniref:methionyl-tRNA formyltransferase n=1 Tax=Hydrogenophaga sp. TaxID=1904254 RepID=UPI0019C786E3|nr:methionyl-tRNA formyltransferase [Hydrogenophaga sp.]MBD3893152.1 methionyl-tRNA formyltransferase [Hydrogenophaga sp.]